MITGIRCNVLKMRTIRACFIAFTLTWDGFLSGSSATQMAFAPAGKNRAFGSIEGTTLYEVTVNGEPWSPGITIGGTSGTRYEAILSDDDRLVSLDHQKDGTYWGIGRSQGLFTRDFGDWRGSVRFSGASGIGPVTTIDGESVPQGHLLATLTFHAGQFPDTQVIERETLVPVIWDDPVTAGIVERVTPEQTEETWLIHDIQGPWANPDVVLFDEVLDGVPYEVRLERFGFSRTRENPVPFGVPEPNTCLLFLLVTASAFFYLRKYCRMSNQDPAGG